jgi:Protein of unknown function (DUF2786)
MSISEREKALGRVRKLLAHCLGDGTTFQEADTARLLAKKLMAEYRISMDEMTGGSDGSWGRTGGSSSTYDDSYSQKSEPRQKEEPGPKGPSPGDARQGPGTSAGTSKAGGQKARESGYHGKGRTDSSSPGGHAASNHRNESRPSGSNSTLSPEAVSLIEELKKFSHGAWIVLQWTWILIVWAFIILIWLLSLVICPWYAIGSICRLLWPAEEVSLSPTLVEIRRYFRWAFGAAALGIIIGVVMVCFEDSSSARDTPGGNQSSASAVPSPAPTRGRFIPLKDGLPLPTAIGS